MREIITTCDICGKKISNQTEEISLPCKLIDNGELFDVSMEKLCLCEHCYLESTNICRDINNKNSENGHPRYFIKISSKLGM